MPVFDAITRYFASLDNPYLVGFSLFFDSYIVFIYLFIFLIFMKYLDKNRLIKAILSIILSLVLTFILKYYFRVPRPCMLDPTYAAAECPIVPDYSFPSGHTAISASFLAAFIGTPAFNILFILNLLVGFSRINLGVHFLNDVLASNVIAFFSFDIVDRLLSNRTLNISRSDKLRHDLEMRRKLFHISIGSLSMLAIFLLSKIYLMNGIVYSEFILFIVLEVLLIFISNHIRTGKSYILGELIKIFERAGARPGYGAYWYGLGLLFSMIFIKNVNFLFATIIALAIGDGLATIVGINGKIKNPINRKKTVEGTLAFMLSTMILSIPFIGPLAIPFAILTSIVESLPPKFDDNFTIPLVGILFYLLFA